MPKRTKSLPQENDRVALKQIMTDRKSDSCINETDRNFDTDEPDVHRVLNEVDHHHITSPNIFLMSDSEIDPSSSLSSDSTGIELELSNSSSLDDHSTPIARTRSAFAGYYEVISKVATSINTDSNGFPTPCLSLHRSASETDLQSMHNQGSVA